MDLSEIVSLKFDVSRVISRRAVHKFRDGNKENVLRKTRKVYFRIFHNGFSSY